MSSSLHPRSLALLVALLVALPLRAQTKPEPPVPVRTVAPDYPYELRREGIAGVVTISCVIDARGNVTDVTVEKSTNPAFNNSAVAALKKWKFKPATLEGEPVAQKIIIPLKFNVQET